MINGVRSTSGGLFVPRVSFYDLYPAKERFAVKLDALYVDGTNTAPKSDQPFLQVELNNASRVFLLLNGPLVTRRLLRNVTSFAGLGDRWHSLRALQSCNASSIPVGDSRRLGRQLYLPAFAAAVETHVAKDEKLVLPHPGLVSLNGAFGISRYTLLFARPGSADATPVPFEYPSSPTNVTELVSESTMRVVPALSSVQCPQWLHDLYMVESRDLEVATMEGELPFWRTWHPVIDPIYWCYFGHEHGSYPGKHMPMFGYTAFKTYDPFTLHNRQDESHEGFKVFSFPLHDQRKFVMVTVHMHLSQSRRFQTRFHSLTLAIINEFWELEMELHMKGDFGSAQATLADGSFISTNEYQEGIYRELRRNKKMLLRRFNVLNVNASYPQSVDMRFLLNGRRTPSETNRQLILRGIYEQWKGFLNTCAWSGRPYFSGLSFDSRNPATAMRTLDNTTEEDMQVLAGDSMDRVMVISNNSGSLEVGIEHCFFDVFRSDCGVSLERSGGVFYTDAYFSVIRNGSGRNNVRQFIRPGFKTVTLSVGTISAKEPWNAHMEYVTEAEDSSSRFMNVEMAVNAALN